MPCGISSGRARSPMTPSRRCARCVGSARGVGLDGTAGGGGWTALGPPEAAGRWSLVAPEIAPATATERLHAQSLALLERHGVVTREAVAIEGIEGGFAAVYPVLRAMEDAGRPAAAISSTASGRRSSRWRAHSTGCVRCASPPSAPPKARSTSWPPRISANSYGAALPWPRRGETDRRPLQRAAGAYVVLVDGIAALYLERGGATLQTLPASDDPAVAVTAARALRTLVDDGRIRELVLRKVDGEEGNGLTRPVCPASRPASWPAIAAWPSVRSAATPECPKATRSSGPRRVSGPTSSAGPSPPPGTAGPGAGPAGHAHRRARDHRGRVHRQEPADPLRQRPRDPDPPPDERLVAPLPTGRAVAATGRTRPARDRGPGAVAVCFDAPVVELLEQRAEVLHASLGRLGPDLLSPEFDADEAIRRLRDPSRAGCRSPRRCSIRGRWPGSATSGRTRRSGPSVSRRSRRSASWTTRHSVDSLGRRDDSYMPVPAGARVRAPSTVAAGGRVGAAGRSSRAPSRGPRIRGRPTGARPASRRRRLSPSSRAPPSRTCRAGSARSRRSSGRRRSRSSAGPLRRCTAGMPRPRTARVRDRASR